MNYRLIYYVPDHARGDYYTIAVAVSINDVVKVIGTSCKACLSEQSAASLSMIRHSLRSLGSIQNLPDSIGPHVRWSEIRTLWDDLNNPEEWIKKHVLGD